MTVAGNGVRQSGIDDRPLHSVSGVKDLQPRNAGESAVGHVVVLSYADDIGVGIVVRKNRIGITGLSGVRHYPAGYKGKNSSKKSLHGEINVVVVDGLFILKKSGHPKDVRSSLLHGSPRREKPDNSSLTDNLSGSVVTNAGFLNDELTVLDVLNRLLSSVYFVDAFATEVVQGGLDSLAVRVERVNYD